MTKKANKAWETVGHPTQLDDSLDLNYLHAAAGKKIWLWTWSQGKEITKIINITQDLTPFAYVFFLKFSISLPTFTQ